MASFTVQFISSNSDSASAATHIQCDGYAQEGTMLTFFRFGADCDTIDSWSRRVASYRIADVASVVRSVELDSISEIPVLVAC